MFPYPSGRIHMGHVRNYTMGDVVARYKRAKGFNVLHPMGWDAFGLPAENAAMENKVHPRPGPTTTSPRCAASSSRMGLSLDWSARVRDLRSRLLPPPAEAVPRLAGRRASSTARSSKVNWDPVDQTVLANEQVIDGRGWRSGALVEQRELTQWFFKITDYADDLLAGARRRSTAGRRRSG